MMYFTYNKMEKSKKK